MISKINLQFILFGDVLTGHQVWFYDKDNNKYQFLQEIMPTPLNMPDLLYLMNKIKGNKDHHCVYKDKIILYNRYEDYNNHGFV